MAVGGGTGRTAFMLLRQYRRRNPRRAPLEGKQIGAVLRCLVVSRLLRLEDATEQRKNSQAAGRIDEDDEVMISTAGTVSGKADATNPRVK